MSHWTDEEISSLKDKFGKLDKAELEKEFDRGYGTIFAKAKKLGLTSGGKVRGGAIKR